MSFLFGWVPADATADVADVADAMAAALRVHDGQQVAMTVLPGVAVGVIEPPALGDEADDLNPARTADGRFSLWLAGEVVASDDSRLSTIDVARSRLPEFRRTLLSRWLEIGIASVRSLDGDFQVAIWDARERVLTIANDRFGGLPMYWSASPHGVAFAGGVRGVLMAPGVSCEPDLESLREAMTFGGFRLGDRTNVDAVRMVPGASMLTIQRNAVCSSRYWSWRDIGESAGSNNPSEIINELGSRWRTAIARRMAGPGRFGQTLSGGLDSRAILAEAAPRTNSAWTAITYGLPDCDDARYAERAAKAVGASWRFYELYSGGNPDWLDRRASFIQQTDGLMQLGDLMHMEALDLQRSSFDVHLSGYVGDAIMGPTFTAVSTPEQAMYVLPYYDTPVSLPYDEALARVTSAAAGLGDAPARFVLFEHKLPQSTNRWTAAWRPWFRVRKPFLDHALFDLCQRLPLEIRGAGQVYERWLASAYPGCFRSIPNQKTGVPILAPRWRWQAARVARRAVSSMSRVLPHALRPAPRIRSYFDDDRMWRMAGVIDRILGPMQSPTSLTGQILGRERVHQLLDRWRADAAAPAQAIGALHVYDLYHRGLPDTLRRARSQARGLRGMARTSTL